MLKLEQKKNINIVNEGLTNHNEGCIDHNGNETMNLNYIKKIDLDYCGLDVSEIQEYLNGTDKEVILKLREKEYFVGFGIGIDEGNVYRMACFRRDYDLAKIGCKPMKSGHLSHVAAIQEEELLESEGDYPECDNLCMPEIEFDCVDEDINSNNYFEKRENNKWYSVKGIYETEDAFVLTLGK